MDLYVERRSAALCLPARERETAWQMGQSIDILKIEDIETFGRKLTRGDGFLCGVQHLLSVSCRGENGFPQRPASCLEL
jgi:hypothetical protein